MKKKGMIYKRLWPKVCKSHNFESRKKKQDQISKPVNVTSSLPKQFKGNQAMKIFQSNFPSLFQSHNVTSHVRVKVSLEFKGKNQ